MKRRVVLALCGLLTSTALIACGPPPARNTAKKVGKDATLGENAPSGMSEIKFQESERDGDPKLVGCADGQREGFADIAKFPSIAGCLGVWDGNMTLRKSPSQKPCGDDLDVCASPADVCAQGWHVCARDGDYHDLVDRIDDKQCSEGAGPGKFLAGISHVKKKKECAPPPGPTTRYPCLKSGYGAEAVCCGQDCRAGQCRDAVWPKQTRISVGKAEGCGAITSERNGGVLCCQDTAKPTLPQPHTIAPIDAVPTPVDAGPVDVAAPDIAKGDAKPDAAKPEPADAAKPEPDKPSE